MTLPEALVHGYRRGAQDCREMMARFVEQGGDPVMANSIRLNWNPSWGTDPGKPETNIGITWNGHKYVGPNS